VSRKTYKELEARQRIRKEGGTFWTLEGVEDKVTMVVDCLVQLDGGKWKRRQVSMQTGNMIFQEDGKEVLKVGRGDVVKREGLGLVAWPKSTAANRKQVQVGLIVEESGSRKQVSQWLDQLARRQQGRLLVFINPFSGTGRAERRWEQVMVLTGLKEDEVKVVVTQKAGQARQMLKTMELDEYRAVVSVSGDGLFHEVLNGLASRDDWEKVRRELPLGLVPGGSGNAVHCSLLHQLAESFDDEVKVAGLNILKGESRPVDYIECETREARFLSIFGVAWGFIPEADIGSEVLRWMGPSRAYLWVAWRFCFLRVFSGSVSYLEAKSLSNNDFDMPHIDAEVPESWTTLKGDFLNVYACKQSWLDYNALLHPEIRPNDGDIWLVIIRGPISRIALLSWLLKVDTAGHLEMKETTVVKVKAFRFDPTDPGPDCPMTVDAEVLQGQRVQGRIREGGCRMLVKPE